MSEIFTRRFNSMNRSKCVVLLHTTFSALHSILYQFIGSLLRYQQRNNKFNCTLSFCILWPHALLCMQILCLLRGVNNLISVLMLHRTALNPHTVSSKWGANLNDDPLRSTAETEIRPNDEPQELRKLRPTVNHGLGVGSGKGYGQYVWYFC